MTLRPRCSARRSASTLTGPSVEPGTSGPCQPTGTQNSRENPGSVPRVCCLGHCGDNFLERMAGDLEEGGPSHLLSPMTPERRARSRRRCLPSATRGHPSCTWMGTQ